MAGAGAMAGEPVARWLSRRSAWFAMLLTVVGLAAHTRCPTSQKRAPGESARNQSQQDAQRRVRRSAALLKAAVRQLNDLPSGINTTIRPPVIVIDSTKSSDSQDVLGVLLPNPSVPDGLINLLAVPSKNSRFVGNSVRPGDILKFYVKEDETVDEESRHSGFSRRAAMEFTVAQVLDDQTLLIESSLSPEVEIDVVLLEAVPQLGESGDIVRVRAGTAYSTLFPQNLATPVPEKIEIWRLVSDRLVEIQDKLEKYRDRRLPPLGWEPSPDAKTLEQIVVWLNQWLRQSMPKADWHVDPLLQTLSPELLADKELAPYLSNDGLSSAVFERHEGRLLQEAIWHRDIARWARGESFNNVDRAAALFDWTVQNVQLIGDDAGMAHRPWQVLLFGRGTAEQRAWVFALLCRQLGLDVVMLATATLPAESDTETTAAPPRFWLPALVEQGQLYLFDTRLGLPVPGPNGEGVATLRQVQTDDAVLRQLDLPDLPYSFTSDAAKHVVSWIVADPFELTRRARLVERELAGDDRVTLTAYADVLAEQLKSLSEVGEIRLWELPFRTLRTQLTLENTSRNPARTREVFAFEPFAVRPVLWKARMRHFQGRRQILDEEEADQQDETTNDHREATQLYMDKTVRPTDRVIAQSTYSQRVDNSAKLDATYWIGLLSFADGKFDIAESWLNRPELHATDSRWAFGARYNLARSYEAQGRIEEAIALLNADSSPQQHGNKLRARRLRTLPKNETK
jgi:TolA-binding protein